MNKALLENPEVQRELKLELARIDLFEFCKLMHPNFYKEERKYLKDFCRQIQDFIESDEQTLVINAPPRHGKSLTAQNLTAWLFGKNPKAKVMTGSYNDTVSGIFARNVRNMIQTEKAGSNIIYSDIFPETRVKYGEAAASMWSLEGSSEPNYLATSPKGTATGFGANFLIIDDVIKSSQEAYNERVLDEHWDWFNNTMFSRVEGNDWKIILVMTRWATGDLAGRFIEEFKPRVIEYRAVTKTPKGKPKMLCDDILNYETFKKKTRAMNMDIVEANYNQKPIDVAGRLFKPFMEWDELPEGIVENITDTADKGADFLASANYIKNGQDVYITDITYTDKPMEFTEKAVAEMLDSGDVSVARIESNNGGRGFARNVKRILEENGNSKVVIKTPTQTKNKESRILSSSAWLQNHLFMPPNWQKKWPEAANEVLKYQRKGKNAHDDMCDILAGIFEQCTARAEPIIITNSNRGSTGTNSLIF